MQQLNGDGTLSHRRSHPIPGPVSHVAGRQDSRHTRLEQERRTIEPPGVIAGQIRAGQNKSFGISIDLRWQPLGPRAIMTKSPPASTVSSTPVASLRSTRRSSQPSPPPSTIPLRRRVRTLGVASISRTR
jgi:hypothetical protein